MTMPAARATRPGRLKNDRLRVVADSVISVASDERFIKSAHQTHQTGVAAQKTKEKGGAGEKRLPRVSVRGLLDDHGRADGRPAIEAGHSRGRDVDAAVTTAGQVRAWSPD